MSAAKWLYYFLAMCVAVATLAFSYAQVARKHYQVAADGSVFAPSTGDQCYRFVPDGRTAPITQCRNLMTGKWWVPPTHH